MTAKCRTYYLVMEWINKQLTKALVSIQMSVEDRKGADSLEWIAVAVVLIAAVLIAFEVIIGIGIQTKATEVIDSVKSHTP